MTRGPWRDHGSRWEAALVGRPLSISNEFLALRLSAPNGHEGPAAVRSGPSAKACCCRGLIRTFHRLPPPLRLGRGLLCGFRCGFRRSLGQRVGVRGLGHAARVHRTAKMHRASTHVAIEHGVLRLSDLPLCRELAGTVGHGLNCAFDSRLVFSTATKAEIAISGTSATKAENWKTRPTRLYPGPGS